MGKLMASGGCVGNGEVVVWYCEARSPGRSSMGCSRDVEADKFQVAQTPGRVKCTQVAEHDSSTRMWLSGAFSVHATIDYVSGYLMNNKPPSCHNFAASDVLPSPISCAARSRRTRLRIFPLAFLGISFAKTIPPAIIL